MHTDTTRATERSSPAVAASQRHADLRSATASSAWSANHLLAALDPADKDRLFGHLQLVTLRAGDVLHDGSRAGGGTMHHAFFPVTAIVSLVCVADDGSSNEVAVVGPEGLVGAAQLLGDCVPFTRSVVHAGGHALRIDSQHVQRAFDQEGSVRELLLRYLQGVLRQVAQTATCNRHHPIDRQLAKRLLMAMDRQRSHELSMTQESIAGMLGVRREGVTAAALKLQRAGILRYSRGKITVLDRSGLEQQSCACYSVARDEFERLRKQPLAPAITD